MSFKHRKTKENKQIIQKTCSLRLYPNSEQEKILARHFGLLENRSGKARINASGEGVLVEDPQRKRKSDGGLNDLPKTRKVVLDG